MEDDADCQVEVEKMKGRGSVSAGEKRENRKSKTE